MKNKVLYCFFIILSIVLVVISMTVLNNTKVLAPVVLVISIYLFLGAIIKLCKTNDKLKNTIVCVLDLLFWLP